MRIQDLDKLEQFNKNKYNDDTIMVSSHHSVGQGRLVLPILLIIIQWMTSKHPVEARPAPKVSALVGKKVTTVLKIDVQGHKALQQNVTTADGYADLSSRIAGTMEKMEQHVKVCSRMSRDTLSVKKKVG